MPSTTTSRLTSSARKNSDSISCTSRMSRTMPAPQRQSRFAGSSSSSSGRWAENGRCSSWSDRPVRRSFPQFSALRRLERFSVVSGCLGTGCAYRRSTRAGFGCRKGTHLQVADIDSGRMVVHVRHGKGAKDRYVPLPQHTLEMLREYWKTHRNPELLFPAEGRNHIELSKSTEPMSKSRVQGAVPLLTLF